MVSRYQEYRELHQCSIQEAKRVLGLEDRIKTLNELRSELGEVYTPQTVAEKLVRLLDLLIADAEAEHRR